MKRYFSCLLTLLLLTALLGGCTQPAQSSAPAASSSTGAGNSGSASSTPSISTATGSGGSSSGEAADLLDVSTLFSDRDCEVGYSLSDSVAITLTGSSAACDSNTVQIDGSTVTITAGGTYLVTGRLTGQLVVNAEKTENVQLVLENASISNTGSAALYLKQADKLVVTLAAGSSNSLSGSGDYVDIDENSIDSVLFAKDDLTINGSGKLTVTAEYGHGIVGKDDLAITGGEFVITAAEHGIAGKDSVKIADGSFTITSGKDAVHSENKDDATLGFIYVGGGSFDLTAGGDGLDAATIAQLDGGSFTVTTGGGSGATLAADASAKGVKAGQAVVINSGTLALDTADDAVHSNGDVTVTGGTLTIATGDDGLHADSALQVSGGGINVTKSYEGLEGLTVTISGGTISVVSSDDGINAAGGNDSSGFGTRGGSPDTFGSGSGAAITISGGVINVDAQGDGIDSNGSLTITGGETYITGPTGSGNSALDYDGSGQISSGVLIAVGPAGMAQSITASGQGVIATALSGNAGSTVTLSDSSGKVIASYTPTRAFSFVVVSAPDIAEGQTYTLAAGSQSVTAEMTTLQYGSTGGGMGGGRGMGGGKRGTGTTVTT